jgi:hypothetical protein
MSISLPLFVLAFISSILDFANYSLSYLFALVAGRKTVVQYNHPNEPGQQAGAGRPRGYPDMAHSKGWIGETAHTGVLVQMHQ